MILAAIRDPKTMKIYSGDSHAHILDDMDDIDKETARRIQKIYVETGRMPTTAYVGFTDGSIFLPRSQALKEWGVYDSTDLRRVNAR